MSGDTPGEAQLYYEAYLAGGDVYEISAPAENSRLYVKDSVALYLTGSGKVNAAVSTLSVLTDPRFDFSNAYIISTGCAGSATQITVMGDVFIGSAVLDYDLGHHADPREMENPSLTTWFHSPNYDSSSNIMLSGELTDKVYELVKDVKPETTPKTRAYMASSFDNAGWAVRDPKVMKGTIVSSDNFWKGYYSQANAVLITETYQCPDPFVASEMEDVAIGVVLKRLGMLDRYIVIRGSVNMAVFMGDSTPEKLWGYNGLFEESEELSDIFETAMRNIFAVGSKVVDAILSGSGF